MDQCESFGVIGGSGMLGSAILRGLLAAGCVAPRGLWIANRRGSAGEFGAHGVRATTDPQELAHMCSTILYCVPPAVAEDWRIDAPDRLVLSVMAGVTRARLAQISGASRIVRAMSSPAAARRLAYSPWIASDAVTAADRSQVRLLLGAIGLEDEVPDEDHIAQFTALTGPVPGFVAFFAEVMQTYATGCGIPEEIADRAMRQLFLASGQMLAEDPMTASEQVQQMIDYAGTTAAGIEIMRAGPIRSGCGRGIGGVRCPGPRTIGLSACATRVPVRFADEGALPPRTR